MDRTKLLDKIKKCMALGKSPNEHEAAAAMRQAQKLIERNGVTEMELGAIGIAMVNVSVPVQSNQKFPRYLNFLLQIVKESCGVRALIGNEIRVSDYSYVIRYIGPEHRTIMAEYAHSVLFSAMNRSWTQYLKDHLYLKGERGARTSYLMGWLHGVRQNVSEYGITEEEEAGVNTYIELHFGKIPEAEINPTAQISSIVRDGAQAAASFKLMRGMGGRPDQLKIEGK